MKSIRGRTNTHLPGHEADSLDDGRLYDLFSGEDTPGHGVGPVGVIVCPEIATFIDYVVGDVGVLLNLGYQGGEELGREEELEVCLMKRSYRSVARNSS